MRLVAVMLGLALFCFTTAICAAQNHTTPLQNDAAWWHDPSPHIVHFVKVEAKVRLEVLDWGGSGRPVVLLAGSGNTAHIFDEFAPTLTDSYHVYGITRRGFGLSSLTDSGYTDQRLADDVWQVIESLHLTKPILVGHSMSGGELTTLGNQHSNKLAALIYLDAVFDPADFPSSSPAYMALYEKLPGPMRDHVGPAASDLISFAAYRQWQVRSGQVASPEADLRNTYDTNPDGSIGAFRTPAGVSAAIGKGTIKRDYSNIRVPILALFPSKGGTPQYEPKNEQERAAIADFDSATAAYVDRWKKALQSAPTTVRIVDVPGANHYIFLSNEADVLREMRVFMSDLP
jgi:non-heme chloroperoxidase